MEENMNVINNKRKRLSQEKIEKAFVELLQYKEINQITVTDICKLTHINRTTFYNNYLDIYDLADKIRLKLVEDVTNLYEDERTKGYNSNDFSKIFQLIKDNPLFFKTYFKLENDPNILAVEEPYRYDTNLSKAFYNDEYIKEISIKMCMLCLMINISIIILNFSKQASMPLLKSG